MKFNTISLIVPTPDTPLYRFVWLDDPKEVAMLTYVKGTVNIMVRSTDYARMLYRALRKAGGTARWGGVQERESDKMTLTKDMKRAIKILAGG